MSSLFELFNKTYKMAKPHERKSVINNAAYLSALQFVTFLLPIIVVPYLFRVIGPEKFGLLAFAGAFTQYFVILTDYGFNVSATKEISLCGNNQKKLESVFSSVMAVKFILTILSMAIVTIFVCLIPKFQNDWLVYLFNFGVIAGSVLFPNWFFQGREKMKYITVLNIISGVMVTVFILSFVKNTSDYIFVPLINSLGALLAGVLGQYIAFSRFKLKVRLPKYHELIAQFGTSWNVFISIAAINAYTATRVFILGLFTNNIVTGFYSMAENIANAVQTFPLGSFSQAVFPRLSKIFHTDKIKALRLMEHIQQIAVLISSMCLPIIIIFAGPLIKLVCGKPYPETVLALRLLLIAVFFVTANAFRVQFLIVCGKTDIYSKIHVTMALLGLPLILILIGTFSYIGASIATIILEAGVFTVTYFTIKRLSLKA
jgi:PST family polysaccharide transporter